MNPPIIIKADEILKITLHNIFKLAESFIINNENLLQPANIFYRKGLIISNTDWNILTKWKKRESGKFDPNKLKSFYRNLLLTVERFGNDDYDGNHPIILIFQGLIYMSILSNYHDIGFTCIKVVIYHYDSSNFRHKEYAKIALKSTVPNIFKRYIVAVVQPVNTSSPIQDEQRTDQNMPENTYNKTIRRINELFFKIKLKLCGCMRSMHAQPPVSQPRSAFKSEIHINANESCLAYIKAFASIDSDISEYLSESIIVTSRILNASPWNSDVLKLTKLACKSSDNSIKFGIYGFNGLLKTLNFNYNNESPNKIVSFSLILSIMSSVIELKHMFMSKDALELVKIIYSDKFYIDILFQGAKNIIGFRKTTRELSQPHVTLSVEMMNCLFSICKTNLNILRECCYKFHLVDILLVALKEPNAEPNLLYCSIEGMSIILSNEDTRNTYFEYVTTETSYFVPLLSYFQTIEKQYHDAISQIAKMFSLFLTLGSNRSPIAKTINRRLEHNGRDEYLLDGVELGGLTGLECVKCLSLSEAYTITIVSRLSNILSLKSFFDDLSLEMIGYIIKILTKVISFDYDIYLPDSQVVDIFMSILSILNRSLNIPKLMSFEKAMFARICAAEFIIYFGFTDFGREQLSQHTLELSEILFLEQENCPYNHADLGVERIYNGCSIPLLVDNAVRYNSDTPNKRLNPECKQTFRILSSLADFLNRVVYRKKDSFDNILSKCIESEKEMFSITPTTECDEQYKDQRSVFLDNDMAEKLLNYLSSYNINKTFVTDYRQVSEYFVGVLKGDKLTFEEQTNPTLPLIGDWFVKNYRGGIATCKDLEQAIVEENTSMLSPSKLSYGSSAALLLANYQKVPEYQLEIDICYDNFKRILPNNLIWSNAYLKQLNPSFTLAAYLRCLYGLLMDSSSLKYLSDKFRSSDFVCSLINLLKDAPLLECNLYSKFCIISFHALSFDPQQRVESMDMVIIYDIITRFCNSTISFILPYLYTGINVIFDPKMLNMLIFIKELLRLVHLLLSQTLYIKFSDTLSIQQWCVEKCLTRFVTTETLEFIHLMLNYVLTLETASYRGTYVAHHYDALSTKLIENLSLKILQLLICNCPSSRRFEALYRIVEAKETEPLIYRQTMIDDLLSSCYYDKLRGLYQVYIAETEKTAEAITICSRIMYINNKQYSENLLLLSNHYIHLLDIPRERSLDDLNVKNLDFNSIIKGRYPLDTLANVTIYQSIGLDEDNSPELANRITPNNICYMKISIDNKEVKVIFPKLQDFQLFLSKMNNVTTLNLPEGLSGSIYFTVYDSDNYDKIISIEWEYLIFHTINWDSGEETVDEKLNLKHLEKVTFPEELSVYLKFKGKSEDKITFLDDSSLQSFKRSLAQAIYYLEDSGKWKRSIHFKN